MKEHTLFQKEINDYCILCSTDESKLAKEIYETTMEMPNAHMLVGKIVGDLLAILVSLTKTQRILEIGTFTGYSAAIMASGLRIGKITTLEENIENYQLSKKNLHIEIEKGKIQVINTEGITWLKNYTGKQFDIIFLDARKEAFSNDLDLLHNKLSINGLLVIDNSLARGAVLNPISEWQKLTDNFNKKIKSDVRFRVVLLPIRDGLLVAQKVV
jgi:caffeoyl-CoA O-methyltransferase